MSYNKDMNILVVEDEKRLARNIADALRVDSYNVSVAEDGLAAEKQLREGHFDLVVMDRMMPRQDGIKTLQKIREKEDSTPVLMLTALGQTEDKIQGLDAGADDYLTKPFEISELRARVRALLRRPEKQIKDVLEYDSLVLNCVQKEAYRKNHKIELSATEFRLLEFLMRNTEIVQSETKLLDHVWDQNYDGLSNVVAVYVRYIRNKIDKDFPHEQPLVQTVRGLGYKISI